MAFLETTDAGENPGWTKCIRLRSVVCPTKERILVPGSHDSSSFRSAKSATGKRRRASYKEPDEEDSDDVDAFDRA